MRDELSPYARLCDFLPEGATASGFVVVFEALDAEGELYLHVRSSEGVPPWKAVGMMTTATDQMRDDLRTPYVHVIQEDDEDD